MAVVTFPARQDWETVNQTLSRIEVPGGWIYRTILYEWDTVSTGGQPLGVAMVFVPNPTN